jgi:hypothetical protein
MTYPGCEETLERFRAYLGNTTFTRYEDASEPIIHVSADATMGWVLVQVHITGVDSEGQANEAEFDATWSWVSIFEKRKGEWLRAANVSNRHDGPPH